MFVSYKCKVATIETYVYIDLVYTTCTTVSNDGSYPACYTIIRLIWILHVLFCAWLSKSGPIVFTCGSTLLQGITACCTFSGSLRTLAGLIAGSSARGHH